MAVKTSFFAFARMRFSIWFGFFLLGASLIFKIQSIEAQGYESDGEKTQAAVIGKRTHRGRDRTIHHLMYRFRAPDGQPYEGDDTVDQPTWDATREGDPVQIEYRRSRPGTNRLAGKKTESSAFYTRTSRIVLLAGMLWLFFAIRNVP
jgi:hypothetical protein